MPSDMCLSTFNFIDLSYFESVSFVLESDKQRDVYLGLALNNSSLLSLHFVRNWLLEESIKGLFISQSFDL